MTYLEMDIFSNIEKIGDMIIPNTLLLCDNGNKPEEVRLLAPYLKDGCVIMAHDYSETKEIDYLYGGEITWDDVKDLGLIKYHYELMRRAGWLSLKSL